MSNSKQDMNTTSDTDKNNGIDYQASNVTKNTGGNAMSNKTVRPIFALYAILAFILALFLFDSYIKLNVTPGTIAIDCQEGERTTGIGYNTRLCR